MDEPKRTRAEARAYAELMSMLAAQERWLAAYLAGSAKLPVFAASRSNREEPEEVEVEIDIDVAKWFKALGPTHLDRMNAVLRVYARDLGRGE